MRQLLLPVIPLSGITELSIFAVAALGGYSANTIAIISAAVVVAVTASLPNSRWGTPDPLDTLPWDWNAASVASYWSRRPVAVARRSAAVTIAGLTVGSGLLLDRAAGGCPGHTYFMLRHIACRPVCFLAPKQSSCRKQQQVRQYPVAPRCSMQSASNALDLCGSEKPWHICQTASFCTRDAEPRCCLQANWAPTHPSGLHKCARSLRGWGLLMSRLLRL